MTSRQEKLIENYVRTKVRSMLKEGSKDIRKVDRSNLATVAGKILDVLIKAGAKGTYDSDSTEGTVIINGTTVNFRTGAEQIHFDVMAVHSHNPEKAVKSLVSFLDDVSNYR